MPPTSRPDLVEKAICGGIPGGGGYIEWKDSCLDNQKIRSSLRHLPAKVDGARYHAVRYSHRP